MGAQHFRKKPGLLPAVAAVLVGWLLLLPQDTPNPLVRWSYDFLQLFLPRFTHPAPVIIYLDEQAMQDYGQQPDRWDRAIHARLLDRLTRDSPAVVVFDIMPTQAGDAAADMKFAQAIRRNKRVVLAGDRVNLTGLKGSTIIPPLELFATNAAAWGMPMVRIDPDRVARRFEPGDDQALDLAWAAATVAGAAVTQEPEDRMAGKRWLNYHGSPRPFEEFSMTYSNAETRAEGFFKDKAVFIGGKPQTLSRGDITDVFPTPFTKWNSTFAPGVDITAIAYVNLVHNEWLRRTGTLGELGLLLLAGAGAGLWLQRLRLRAAFWVTLIAIALVITAAVAGVLLYRVWFPWMVVGLVQLPCVFLIRLYRERAEVTPAMESVSEPSARAAQAAGNSATTLGRPEIPDHELIRCIGEGAYGQVWIARNAVGIYHAVKVVYQNRFPIQEPYERALRGIRKFMPVSRSHEGFVHILHVGRNEPSGFFFYIMEAGDDQQAGQQIDPATYVPRTLAGELKRRESLPPRECLAHLLALTDAVERLHHHQLVHRDIKPANIIFVSGQPKLADIDLVTDMSSRGDVSCVGTEGYLAPEGPGTAAADVFSLGRVLYVALTGKRPDQCPELPTRVADQPDCGLFLQLHEILCKACELDLDRRYATAGLMHGDLLNLSRRLEQEK